MTKKDYKKIAECLKKFKQYRENKYKYIKIIDEDLELLIRDFCATLQRDNYRFSDSRFRDYINKN